MHTVVASPTPVLDLRRRTQAPRTRPASPASPASRNRRLAVIGTSAGVLAVVAFTIGLMLVTRGPQGQVLDSTGRPQTSLTADTAGNGAVSSGSAGSVQASAVIDVSAPVTAIDSVTKAAVPGHSILSVSVRWSTDDLGSGLKAQLFQWRTDHDDWVTVRLPSLTARSMALRLPPGHLYTFRVRGVDRAGNVGLFAVKSIRI